MDKMPAAFVMNFPASQGLRSYSVESGLRSWGIRACRPYRHTFCRNSTMASITNLPTSPKDLLIASHDVLVLIFKLFIPPVPVDTPKTRFTRGGRKQLLNLALTCKAFVDPALECLWSHLESLEPLFKLHPGLKKVGKSYVWSSIYIPDFMWLIVLRC